MASAVATKELGAVSTASPGPMPAASRAKRRASVPLLTPMQCCVPQNSAKAVSNCSSMGPLVKAAVLSAWRTTARISSCSSRCGVTRSRNGMGDGSAMIAPSRLAEVAKNPGRVAGHDAVSGNVPSDHAAGADHGVLADGQAGQNGGAGADGGALPHQRGFHFPVLLALQDSGGGGGARISVVDENHA